jgi:hypothetical protein
MKDKTAKMDSRSSNSRQDVSRIAGECSAEPPKLEDFVSTREPDRTSSPSTGGTSHDQSTHHTPKHASAATTMSGCEEFRSSLALFLSQLCQERDLIQHKVESDSSDEDGCMNAHDILPVVVDNAKARPYKLRLIRRRSSMEDLTAMLSLHNSNNNNNAGSSSGRDATYSSTNHEKAEELSTTRPTYSECASKLPHLPFSDDDNSSRTRITEEERQEPYVSVRVIQRPCRWSPDDSFSWMQTNDSPTRLDYLPKYPERKTSREVMPDILVSPQRRSSDDTIVSLHDVLEILERDVNSLDEPAMDQAAPLDST